MGKARRLGSGTVLTVATLAGILATGCTGDGPETRPALFVEVAATSGLAFSHVNGATGELYYPELMHAGCAFVDYDDDGFLDVYLIQSGGLPPSPTTSSVGNMLYRNRGDGTFEDVTDAAGVGDRGYGAGVAVADYDRDGDRDLYVTNLGTNVLYRNNADGTFSNVTAEAGVGDPGYSTSAVFEDLDGDGDLDLYVCNYLDWSPGIERDCYAPSGLRGYCSPGVYERPQHDTLYRNEGDGSFTDVSREAGIHAWAGTGLGVTTADFDGDGLVDIYVANDQMPNMLWINRGDGTFAEEALVRGSALNESGRSEAGMGVTTEDVDDDGDWDLFMVHLDGETNTFYRNAEGRFRDVTDEMSLGTVSQAYTGFGTSLFDFDCDGRLDVFIANGRVRLGDSMREGDYSEPNQLLRGLRDGTFEDVSSLAGPALELLEVSRGAAFGDYDNDGDVDILMTNNAGPVRLFRNEACEGRHWLAVELRGAGFDRDGIGSTVELRTGDRLRRRRVQPGYSYCSSNDPRVHFGLGDETRVDSVTVVWPDGRAQELGSVEGDRLVTVSGSAPGAASVGTAR